MSSPQLGLRPEGSAVVGQVRWAKTGLPVVAFVRAILPSPGFELNLVYSVLWRGELHVVRCKHHDCFDNA